MRRSCKHSDSKYIREFCVCVPTSPFWWRLPVSQFSTTFFSDKLMQHTRRHPDTHRWWVQADSLKKRCKIKKNTISVCLVTSRLFFSCTVSLFFCPCLFLVHTCFKCVWFFSGPLYMLYLSLCFIFILQILNYWEVGLDFWETELSCNC